MRTISCSTFAPSRWRSAWQAEFELGVRDDDPLRLGVRHAAAVDLQRQRLERRDQVLADQAAGFALADVDVVAGVGLGRGREDRLRQAIGFAQAARQLDAADTARSADTPSTPNPTGSRAPRIRSESDPSAAPAWSGRAAGRRARVPRPGTPRPPSRSGDAARDRPCARTRTRTAASAPFPCQVCRSRGRSRTLRCDRLRR